MDVPTMIVLASGVLLRLAVFLWIPNLPIVMDQFSLFSTPINSYISLNEGIYLLSNGLNPYQRGEIIHHPPILLKFFDILKDSQIDDNFNTTLFYSILDLVICLQFIKINKLLNGADGYSPFKIACFYMFNPFTILTSFAKSTYLINSLVVMSVFSSIMNNQIDVAIILLSFSTYLTYYTWYLLVPICYWRYQNDKTISSTLKSVILFISSIAVLFGISYKLSNDSFNFIDLCYLTIIQLKKITPNLGLWWYFFTEIFDPFKYFYLSVFNLYSFVLVLPLSTRFIVPNNKMSLLFVIWIVIGIINFAKPYPILADYSLFYSSIFLFKPYFKYLKISPIASYAALFIVLLQSPSYYIVWMVLSSGNANFFYAVSLTLGLAEAVILSDFVWAFLKDEYYRKQKEITGKQVPETSLTQI